VWCTLVLWSAVGADPRRGVDMSNGWFEATATEGGTMIVGEKNVMGLRDMFSYRGAFYLIMGRRNKSGVQLDKDFATWSLDSNYVDPIKMDRTIGKEVMDGNVIIDTVSKGKDKGHKRLTLTEKGRHQYNCLKLIGNLRIIQRRMARIYMETQPDGTKQPRLYHIS